MVARSTSEIMAWKQSETKHFGFDMQFAGNYSTAARGSSEKEIWSDASGHGLGGHLGPPEQSWAIWNEDHSWMGTIPLTRNTDLLEAMAELKSLQTFASDLSRNDRVICYTDNQGVCNSMRSGYNKHSAVHDVVLEIHQTALELGIHLDPQQVPREHNTIADRLSKGHCPIVEGSWSPLFKLEQARRVHLRRRNRSAISGSFAATYTGERGVGVWKVALRLLKRSFKRT